MHKVNLQMHELTDEKAERRGRGRQNSGASVPPRPRAPGYHTQIACGGASISGARHVKPGPPFASPRQRLCPLSRDYLSLLPPSSIRPHLVYMSRRRRKRGEERSREEPLKEEDKKKRTRQRKGVPERTGVPH